MTADESNPLPASVTSDDREIPLYHWPADASPRAVVQVLHGLAEHAGRYERFARSLNERGLTVVAHDHRGHGPAYAEKGLGHFADRDGWSKVIADAFSVQTAIRAALPATPLVLLGHSMGSYIAQAFCMRHPGTIDALILSGSTSPNRTEVQVARAIAWLLGMTLGATSEGRLLDRMSFGKFNDRFRPNRTTFDWLSRDDVEVDRYINDPLCGAISSQRLWFDLLGGLLDISAADSPARIPESLPILILGGELDPVGGEKALAQLADAYRRSGHSTVDLRVYEDGRHEMLNETNRDDVTADILSWTERQLG